MLQVGYFTDFGPDNVLLLEGHSADLRNLAEAIRPLAEGKQDMLPLHNLPSIRVHSGLEIMLLRGEQDSGIRRLARSGAFAWTRNAEGWQDVLDKLDDLSDSNAGHHHLQADNDEVIVKVAKGQYGAEWWKIQSKQKRGAS